MKTFVVVRFDIEGFHRWKNAKGKREFLRNLHRHLFKIEVGIQVFEDDREIEFFDFLEFCKGEIVIGEDDSCETIARNLLKKINSRFPNRESYCKVFEDGENGSFLIDFKGDFAIG